MLKQTCNFFSSLFVCIRFGFYYPSRRQLSILWRPRSWTLRIPLRLTRSKTKFCRNGYIYIYTSEYTILGSTWYFGRKRKSKVSLIFYKEVFNGFEIQRKRKPKLSSFLFAGTKFFCSGLRKRGFLEKWNFHHLIWR